MHWNEFITLNITVDRSHLIGWTNVSNEEVVLRQFDLEMKYGPCIGISRLARWERAKHLGLDPPEEIYAYLQQENMKESDYKSLWESGVRGQKQDENDRNSPKVPSSAKEEEEYSGTFCDSIKKDDM